MWSCTSRSNICDVAGEDILGELENARVGETGAYGWSPCWVSWRGDVVDRAVERVVEAFDGDWAPFGLSDPGPALEEPSIFFLPKPKRLRLLLLLSFLNCSIGLGDVPSVALGVESPPTLFWSAIVSCRADGGGKKTGLGGFSEASRGAEALGGRCCPSTGSRRAIDARVC